MKNNKNNKSGGLKISVYPTHDKKEWDFSATDKYFQNYSPEKAYEEFQRVTKKLAKEQQKQKRRK